MAEKTLIPTLSTSNLTEPWKDLQAVIVSERKRRKKSGIESRVKLCPASEASLPLNSHARSARPDTCSAPSFSSATSVFPYHPELWGEKIPWS